MEGMPFKKEISQPSPIIYASAVSSCHFFEESLTGQAIGV